MTSLCGIIAVFRIMRGWITRAAACCRKPMSRAKRRAGQAGTESKNKLNRKTTGGSTRMPKYVLVAMNGPVPGGDAEELEKWYKEIHIPDLLSVDGVNAVRRFKTVRGLVKTGDLWP